MGIKNIAISDEAYQRLKALKRSGESFTDVVERLTKSRGVLELAGVLSNSEGKEIKEGVRKIRERSHRRFKRTIEKLS